MKLHGASSDRFGPQASRKDDHQNYGVALEIEAVLRTTICLVLLHSSVLPSASEPGLKPLFVRLPPLAVEGDQSRAAVPQTRAELNEANARATALMDAFDRRIAQSALQATSSICNACSPSTPQRKAHPRRVEASALPEGRIVDDTAQAPAN